MFINNVGTVFAIGVLGSGGTVANGMSGLLSMSGLIVLVVVAGATTLENMEVSMTTTRMNMAIMMIIIMMANMTSTIITMKKKKRTILAKKTKVLY